MKRMIFVLATVLAFTGLVMAQTNPPKKVVKAAVKTEALKLEGTIVYVDAIANTITLKVKTALDTLAVDKMAKITAAGKACKLADLAKGSEAVVNYKVEAGKKVAVMIQVLPPQKKAEIPKKGETKKVEKPAPTPAPVKK